MRRTIQLTRARERRLRDSSKSQLEQLIEAEPTPENEATRKAAERKKAEREAAWRVLHMHFDGLEPIPRGALIAYWTDIEGDAVEDIAEHFNIKPGTLRTNKFRAMAEYAVPCTNAAQDASGTPDLANDTFVPKCTEQADCVHSVGRSIYRGFLYRSATLINDEVKNEFGSK